MLSSQVEDLCSAVELLTRNGWDGTFKSVQKTGGEAKSVCVSGELCDIKTLLYIQYVKRCW